MKTICPTCLVESRVSIDVTDGDTLHCPECDGEFSLETVRKMVAGWAAILPRLDALAAKE